eukprot:371800-Amphidinium_carterae.1
MLSTVKSLVECGFGKYVFIKRLEDKKKQRAFAQEARIVRGTTPRPVTDKLAKFMTRDKRRQVLLEVELKKPILMEAATAAAAKSVPKVISVPEGAL